MMPEVSIHYLMAIFRAFLLTIGHKMNVCIIALDKSGIKMKCSDGLKPLCALVHTKTSNSIVKSCKDQSLKNYDHHVKWLFAF